MESHKTFLIFLGIIIISLIGGIAIIVMNANRCIQTDPTVCKMLRALKRESFEMVSGSYYQSKAANAFTAVWTISKPNKQIIFSNGSEETLNIIISDKNLFVKDYSEKAWWKEPVTALKKYSVDLPFEPESFIEGIKMGLLADSTVYSKPINIRCGSASCIRYQLQLVGNTDGTAYVDISQADSRLVRYGTKNVAEEQVFAIVYKKDDIELPERTKSAKPGENIFLESAKSRPSQKKGYELDFVRDFEEQRKKNE